MHRKWLLLFPILGVVLMSGTLDLDRLFNYGDQPVPDYITRDNTNGNDITNEIATLGRVLFYDKGLSLNDQISCASCHRQEFAFSDTATVSHGFEGGVTGRHSMRLINARFAVEDNFFWDERALSLEDQTTHPIRDPIEMGFSGSNGQPGIDSLFRKMEGTGYYPKLFRFAFGSEEISEEKMRRAMAQFVRSIQSFDTRYDEGRARVANDGAPFPNFTAQENMGKQLFLAPPPMGAGCAGCHRPPEFDIDPNSRNNGVIGVAGEPGATDINNTRAPTLRDIFNPAGELNGPLMHDGSMRTIEEVIEHYNAIELHPFNFNLDPRLAGPPGANGQRLNLSQAQKDALIAFLRTLTGSTVYSDERWSDPFDPDGRLEVTGGGITFVKDEGRHRLTEIYPNPSDGVFQVVAEHAGHMQIYDLTGRLMYQQFLEMGVKTVDISGVSPGTYWVEVIFDGKREVQKILVW